MSKENIYTASLKSTSGAGYTFEDEVAAVFLVEMLAEKPPLLPNWGMPVRLQRQVAQLAPYDDIVLSFCNDEGEEFRCGISVKSALPSSQSGFTPETVRETWSVFHADEFDSARDKLCIASQPLDSEPSKRVHALLLRAQELAPENLKPSMRGADELRCYNSFEHSPKNALPGLLLQCLALRDSFDFEKSVSQARNEALRLCGSLLRGNSDDPHIAALALWKSFVTIAAELRVTSGETTIGGLVQKLKNQHILNESHHDGSIWRKVRQISGESQSAVSVALPSGDQVPRTKQLQDLELQCSKHKVLVILGESGTGKSALGKLFAMSKTNESTEIIWFSSSDIERTNLSGRDLKSLIQRCRKSTGILFLDGAEHWKPNHFEWVKTTLNGISALEGWRAVITCQESEWSRVAAKISDAGSLFIAPFECCVFEMEEIQLLANSNPNIAELLAHEDLRTLVRSPHMLKVMLEAPAHTSTDSSTWKSESDIVSWWWQERVCDGKQIARTGTLARRIAETLADQLETEIAEDAANGSEEAAAELIARGIFARTSDSKLRFVHDLYADWSRVQSLRPRGEELLQFSRDRIENPPWFRSLRIYCQQLLENPVDHPRWRSLIEPILAGAVDDDHPFNVSKISAKDLRILDAALEAIAFCSRPALALEGVNDALTAHNCSLLRRMLRCLSRSATRIDTVALATVKERVGISAAEVSAFERLARLPDLLRWYPVIKFLTHHQSNTVPCIAAEVASIMPMFQTLVSYIRMSGQEPADWWGNLCELAVTCAEHELRWEVEGVWRPDDDRLAIRRDQRCAIYKAGQMAADVFPDRVARLAMKAIGRIKWQKGDLPKSFGEGWLGQRTPSTSFLGSEWEIERPIRSWPHGPRREISDKFADAWLDGGALALARQRPKTTTKVTLASLISWPKTRRRPGMDIHAEKNGFRYLNQMWFPPFWHHGPFLPFLRINRTEGLRLIIQLVNFATDRVAEWWSYDDENHASLIFLSPAGPVNWSGHPNVFGWHICDLNTAGSVTCGLMALEKWLMEELEAKRDVQDVVDLLFTKGRSIAFAGLLLCVGKANHAFLLGPLRPLLTQWHVYLWDIHCEGAMMGTGGGWINDPDFVNKWRMEWREQPHRRLRLQQLCLHLIAQRTDAREIFKEVSDTWRLEAMVLPEKHQNRVPLLRWASDFDFSTWRETTLDDGRKGWTVERPVELNDSAAAEEEQRQMHLITVPLQCAQLLKGRHLLTQEETDEWWRAFEQALEWLDELGVKGDEKMRENPQHTVGGIMAVLLCLGSAHLKAQPERLARIETKALELAATMQCRRVWTAQDTGVDVEWFMIRCAVRLWELCPKTKQWRAFCGSAVTSFKYEIVRALFDEAFLARKKLGSGFPDLCKFVIAYSEQRQESDMFAERDDSKVTKLQTWHAEWFPKFAEGVLPHIDENWGQTLGVEKSMAHEDEELDDEAPLDPQKRQPLKRVTRRKSYGFDFHLLLSAFDCLSPESPPKDATPSEITEWRQIEDNLYTAMLRTLPENPSCNSEDKAPFPYTSEQPILNRIATRCVISTDERAEKLWVPLFQKGPNATRFIQQLVSRIKIAAMKLSADVKKLEPIFRGMLNRLETVDAWNSERVRHGDLWKELLFIGSYVDSKDDEYFSPLMIMLEPFYEKAVRERPSRGFVYSNLIHHLSGTATRSFLPRVFEWCGGWVKHESTIQWRDRSMRDAFSRLLESGWKTSFPAIRKSPAAYESFKAITLRLAALQDPIGLEVQGSIGRSS